MRATGPPCALRIFNSAGRAAGTGGTVQTAPRRAGRAGTAPTGRTGGTASPGGTDAMRSAARPSKCDQRQAGLCGRAVVLAPRCLRGAAAALSRAVPPTLGPRRRWRCCSSTAARARAPPGTSSSRRVPTPAHLLSATSREDCLRRRAVAIQTCCDLRTRTRAAGATKMVQKLGQIQPFIAVFPQECMGQLAYLGPT